MGRWGCTSSLSSTGEAGPNSCTRKKDNFPVYWCCLGTWTLVARQGHISHLEQPKTPLWLWGWLWDGSSSFQSLGQDSGRCPCRETTVPKHILKTQLSRNEQAAEEESGSSEGGKWDHTLEKPLKKLLHSPAACKTWMFPAAKICLQWFSVRPWRNSRVAVVPTPPRSAGFMLLYHPASRSFVKLALQAPKSSVSLKILLGQRNSWRQPPEEWVCLYPKDSTLWFGAEENLSSQGKAFLCHIADQHKLMYRH